MMFALIRNMKRKYMVGVEFILFVPTVTAHDSGSCTISLLRESHSETILMISCLEIIFLFIEFMGKLYYSLLLIH